MSVPLAPVSAGAVNVTDTPGTGLPLASSTVTTSGLVKLVVTTVLCGVPAVAVIVVGVPGLLVRLNVAGVPTPLTDAVTL